MKHTTNMCAFKVEFRNMFDDPLGLGFKAHQKHSVKRVYGGDAPSVKTIYDKSVSFITGR